MNTINKQHSEDTVRIPLFSIGIVCYRNWEYLNDAIDSVLSQDYPRIQLIISDDGSDGFPIDRFRDYIESHRRDNLVEYLVRQSEQNEGTVRHLNHVFDEMHGHANDSFSEEYKAMYHYYTSLYVDPILRPMTDEEIAAIEPDISDEPSHKQNKQHTYYKKICPEIKSLEDL